MSFFHPVARALGIALALAGALLASPPAPAGEAASARARIDATEYPCRIAFIYGRLKLSQ